MLLPSLKGKQTQFCYKITNCLVFVMKSVSRLIFRTTLFDTLLRVITKLFQNNHCNDNRRSYQLFSSIRYSNVSTSQIKKTDTWMTTQRYQKLGFIICIAHLILYLSSPGIMIYVAAQHVELRQARTLSLSSESKHLLSKVQNFEKQQEHVKVQQELMQQDDQQRAATCSGTTWVEACPPLLSSAGSVDGRFRRRLSEENGYFTTEASSISSSNTTSRVLTGDAPSVIYDNYCLLRYRFRIPVPDSKNGGIVTYPYYATSRVIEDDGTVSSSNQRYTKVIIVQHGADRDANAYYCTMQQVVYDSKSMFSNYDARKILVIAPNFNYRTDDDIYKSDAFWNTTKVKAKQVFYLDALVSNMILFLTFLSGILR